MTEAELAEMEQRVSAATPGPWHVDEVGGMLTGADGNYVHTDWAGCHPSDEDTAFIIAARVDVPALVAEVRRLRGLVQMAEWAAAAGEPYDWMPHGACPWCEQPRPSEHWPDRRHASTCPAFPGL